MKSIKMQFYNCVPFHQRSQNTNTEVPTLLHHQRFINPIYNSASAWQHYLLSESGLAKGVVAIVSVCHTIPACRVQAIRKGIAYRFSILPMPTHLFICLSMYLQLSLSGKASLCSAVMVFPKKIYIRPIHLRW